MRKALTTFLVLLVGGVLGWWTLRQTGQILQQLPSRLEEVSLYQGQLIRLRQALADFQKDYGPVSNPEPLVVFGILTGQNPGKKIYLDPRPFHFDPTGIPIDPWKRPFRFEVKNGLLQVVEAPAF